MRGYQRAVISAPQPVTQIWESPTSIDNTGVANVSAALTDWLANTGSPGDIFKLRRGSGFAPGVFWVPQGIRIGKAMTFDLNGCWLLTGTEDGSQYSPLWDDWGEQTLGAWPKHRVCVNVQAQNVTIWSSLTNARIQGAARDINFRGGFTQLPAACAWYAQYEEQHAIRLGGGSASTPKVSNVLIDLNNIALEFVHGDGIFINDNSTNIRVIGQNLGESVVGGQPVNVAGALYLGADGGLGGTISGTQWVPTAAVYPGIHHTGRHGIAAGFSFIGLVVDGVSIWRTGRAIVDLEPAGLNDFINDVTMTNMETGIHTLLWFAAAGPRSINNLTFADNVCYEQIGIDTRNAGATGRHSNWKLHRNRGGLVLGGRDVFEVDRIDGLEVIDNFQVRSSSVAGVDPGSSTNVTISPAEIIQFPFSGSGTGLGLGPLGSMPLGN